MSISPSIFATTDIYAASFAISQGVRLEGCDRRDSRRVVFLLERNAKLDGLLENYWNGEPVTVVPSQLFASLKHLKSLLHSLK